MSILHLVKVRFDMRRADIDQVWLEKRFKFFVEHTARSLARQTTAEWMLWINCQEGMEDRIETLRQTFSDGVNVSSSPDVWRPRYVLFSFGDGPLELSPETLDGVSHVYVTRIDSDDLFAPDALEVVENHKPIDPDRVEALVFQRGYLHDMKSNKTGVYFSHSPPFHTIMFPLKVFQSREEYGKVFHKIGDHSIVHRNLPTQVLPSWKFTVLIHDHNFLSDFSYGREGGHVPKGWTINQFLSPPVVFDVDDFSDTYGGRETLECLYELKKRYPKFKCTLFGIPFATSNELFLEAIQHKWIEVGIHGLRHVPTEELKSISPIALIDGLNRIPAGYTNIFRPPGWYITKGHVEALTRLHMGVALHKRDEKLTRDCRHGYYMCEDRFPCWHGHTHNVCNNWIKSELPKLLTRWNRDQEFAFVSDALLIKT